MDPLDMAAQGRDRRGDYIKDEIRSKAEFH